MRKTMVHLRARTSKCRAGRKEDIEPKVDLGMGRDGWMAVANRSCCGGGGALSLQHCKQNCTAPG